jgi:hypothetical protein
MVEQGRPEAQRAVEAVGQHWPLLLVAGEQVVSRTPLAWDAPALAVDADTARALAAQSVLVLAPLSTQAMLECAALPSGAAPTGGGWLSLARSGPLVPAVLEAARRGERDDASEPLTRAALGLPPAPPDAERLAAWEARERAHRESVVLSVQVEPAAPAANDWRSRSLDELELSVASSNALRRLQLVTIGDLCRCTEADLLKTDGFGRKSLKEVKELLADLGLSLGMTD